MIHTESQEDQIQPVPRGPIETSLHPYRYNHLVQHAGQIELVNRQMRKRFGRLLRLQMFERFTGTLHRY